MELRFIGPNGSSVSHQLTQGNSGYLVIPLNVLKSIDIDLFRGTENE